MNKLDELLDEVDKSKDELVELLQGLVRIPTVNTGKMPTGNETELCNFLKSKLDKEGISAEIIESIPTRGNLIARLGEGQNKKAKLMLMSHTDVVPIGDESKWIHPPFSGSIDKGRIYGRGADDCKSLTACETMVMILMKRLKIPLKQGLILAAGCDEETGSKYGFHWLAKHEKSKIAADFAINEAGGDSFQTPKGLCFTIALGEKGRLDAKINFSGKSCHASVPWEGDNALVKLAHAVNRINEYKPETITSGFVFQDISRLFNIDLNEITPENLDNVINKISTENKILSSMIRGLTRMTITPTMVSGGVKSNVLPDSFSLICDVRLLPGQTLEYLENELHKILKGIDGYELELQGSASPIPSPPNNEFLNSIRRSLVKVMGCNVEVMQSLSIGLTDSWTVRSLGTIVYDFAPGHPDSDTSQNNIHGDNESISIDDLIFRTKVISAIAYDMTVYNS